MAQSEKEVVMSIIKWYPFPGFDAAEEGLHRLARTSETDALMFGGWTPAVDIKETEKEFLVRADLPNVKREELKVSFHEGVLILEGERKLERDERTDTFHRIERGYGRFVRRFAIPNEMNPSGVTAEFKDGVLTVRVPKSADVPAKAIEVKVA
jgi:HSP20 family protein